MLRCALLFVLSVGLASPARAALLEVDLFAPGDALLSRDTVSGFDWLDVTATTELAVAPPWMTILHNCDCHTFEQVVRQLQKAIGCSEAEGWEIARQVHNTGKAVVRVGPEAECVRVGNILAAIGLVVTVVQS